EDVRPAQPVGVHLVAAVEVDVRTELGERVDMRVETSATDHVAPRRRDHRPAGPCEQRPGEQERRPDPAGELRVELVGRKRPGVDAHLVGRRPLDVRAEVGDELHHRLDVADVRDVREAHRLVREHARRQDRQRAVLVARSTDPAVQSAPALDQEGLGGAARNRGHRGSLPPGMEVTRERAWETLTTYTKSEALLRHALAVEASIGWYAQHFGEDEELWRIVALLHDFDYEIHPTLDQHPQQGAPIHRDEVYAGAEGLGIELDDHIRNVVEAMQPIAGELGLRTAETAEAS